MRPTHYEITVDGILPREELDEFVGMSARYGEGTTVLDGVVRDQAALIGTVARIEALGGRVRRYLVRQPECRGEAPVGEGTGEAYGGELTALEARGCPDHGLAALLLDLQRFGVEVVDIRRHGT